MALVNIGNDSWLLEYDACENLSREIMEQLHARNREKPRSVAYEALCGKIRVRMKQHNNEIKQLRDKLQLPGVASHLTDDEKNRRLQKVEKLQVRLMQLQDQFGEVCVPGGTSRSVVVDMETTGWGEDDSEQVRAGVEAHRTLPIQEVRASHSEMIRAQDEGLSQLSQVIGRQKRIAGVISNELDSQNDLLDEIATNMDNVDVRVRRETQSVRGITMKNKTCGYWVVILLLLIAILAVGFS